MGYGLGGGRHKSQVSAALIIKALNTGISEQSQPRTVMAPEQVRELQRRGDEELAQGHTAGPCARAWGARNEDGLS